MSELAIETSSAHGSIALWQDGVCVIESSWQAERNHAVEIFPALEQVVNTINSGAVAPPSVIVVGAGPGSYGGVRVALAAADGLSLVYGATVVSVCSWESIEAAADAYVIADARRGACVLARLVSGRVVGEWEIVPVEDVMAWLRAGTSEAVYSVESSTQLAKLGLDKLGVMPAVPAARGLLTSWLALNTAEQEDFLCAPPSPIYVRDPHIT